MSKQSEITDVILLPLEEETRILKGIFEKIVKEVSSFRSLAPSAFGPKRTATKEELQKPYCYSIYFFFQISKYDEKNSKMCLFCHLFLNLCCLCWLWRGTVRYERDCLICKCFHVLEYKYFRRENGFLAENNFPGNYLGDIFLCEVCLAPEPNQCRVFCKQNDGRCWPTIHKGMHLVKISNLCMLCYLLGCIVQRCEIMEKKKQFFDHHFSRESNSESKFVACLPAIGQGARKSWGAKKKERKIIITLLKKRNPNWKSLSLKNVATATFSRKLRQTIEQRRELNLFIKSNISGLNAFEKNWIHKINRSLKKTEISLKNQKQSRTVVHFPGKTKNILLHAIASIIMVIYIFGGLVNWRTSR